MCSATGHPLGAGSQRVQAGQACHNRCGLERVCCPTLNKERKARGADIFVARPSKKIKAPAERHRPGQSGGGPPQFMTQALTGNIRIARSVVECASPLALSGGTANDSKYANEQSRQNLRLLEPPCAGARSRMGGVASRGIAAGLGTGQSQSRAFQNRAVGAEYSFKLFVDADDSARAFLLLFLFVL